MMAEVREREYICKFCDEVRNSWGELVTHVRTQHPVTDTEIEEWVAAYKQGLSVREIATQTKRNYQTVLKALKKKGVYLEEPSMVELTPEESVLTGRESMTPEEFVNAFAYKLKTLDELIKHQLEKIVNLEDENRRLTEFNKKLFNQVNELQLARRSWQDRLRAVSETLIKD